MAEQLLEDKPITYADRYTIGKKLIEQKCGIMLEVDLTCRATCLHRLMFIAEPNEVKGINFPANFSYMRYATVTEFDSVVRDWNAFIRDIADKGALVTSINNPNGITYGDVIEFWEPLFIPKAMNATSPLELYTLQVAQLDADYYKQFSGATHRLGISIQPSNCGTDLPYAYLPEREWFDKSLHDVQIEDILTLFPKPERELLAICFGRAVVGRSDNILIGGYKYNGIQYDQPIKHTFRTMPVIFGAEPGQGKSVFANMLINALKSVGYKVANFKTMASRFNLGDVVSAHVAYRDDLTSDALERTLKADDMKQAITNAQIRVEDKGVDAVEIWAHALFFTNVNRWNPQIIYSLDDGIMDRVRLISTLYNIELEQLEFEGLSKDTPDPLPFQHIPWLAKKLDVDVNSVILWFLRLCADRFISLTYADAPPRALESEVRHWTNKLRCQFNKDILQCIVSAMMLSYLIKHPDPYSVQFPEISTNTLGEVLQSLAYLMIDRRAHEARSLIKYDWDGLDRPEGHAWKAIARLKHTSVDLAYTEFTEQQHILKNDLNKMVKIVFGAFSLRDGFSVGSGVVYVTSAWEQARMHIPKLKELAKYIHDNIDPELKDYLISDAIPDTEHLYDFITNKGGHSN